MTNLHHLTVFCENGLDFSLPQDALAMLIRVGVNFAAGLVLAKQNVIQQDTAASEKLIWCVSSKANFFTSVATTTCFAGNSNRCLYNHSLHKLDLVDASPRNKISALKPCPRVFQLVLRARSRSSFFTESKQLYPNRQPI
jgi:hypothetical protein